MPRSTKVANNFEAAEEFPLDEIDVAFNFLTRAMLRRYGVAETMRRVGKNFEERDTPN
ncbi:hypothetical protein [Bowmanella sp. JS7-9]|uniref:Uncharacterized protein n=1 Tax=Pseudobowmanella zhangzhouensis TaxID=1537679 RepID=A0ABW1XKH3_9ALTE|nr:hypothetical protein [Bowmanella sp. JS7-9]